MFHLYSLLPILCKDLKSGFNINLLCFQIFFSQSLQVLSPCCNVKDALTERSKYKSNFCKMKTVT